jgi:hypothetical protein
MKRTYAFPTLSVALIVTSLAAAQELNIAPPPTATAPAIPAPATQPEATPSTLPSAESVLQKLLQEKSNAEANGGPTTTQSAKVAAGPEMEQGLIREGQALNDASGHLTRDPESGQFVFVFDNGRFPPMGVVPSRKLWSMEEASIGANPDFHIDAEVTQYRGRNYLLIGGRAGNLPSGGTRVAQVEAVAPNEPPAMRLREGQAIYNRTGRLVRDDKAGTMLFVFDSDGKQMLDPPMGVIPCRGLAILEDASDNGTKPTKFRISAEVTQYRGKNYLYPKLVQAVHDLGQGIGG